MGERGCFLTFHRVAPAALWGDLPNRGFYLGVDLLESILSWLTANRWDVVTIGEALRRIDGPSRCGRFVNISIDDTYRDTFEVIVPTFRKHGVPVTLFVTTGIPDATISMWTTGLEQILLERDAVRVQGDERREVPTADLKREAYGALSRDWEADDPDARYTEFCRDNDFDAGRVHREHAMTWDMLDALARDPSVEIGAHTLSHPRISALPKAGAMRELAESRRRLQEMLGVPADHFAFPYGRVADCGERDFDLARQAGFKSAATTRKGIVRGGGRQDHFRLPRNTLNQERGHTLLTLQAHLTGASGIAARSLGRH